MGNASSKITLLLLFAVALLFSGCAKAVYKGDTNELEKAKLISEVEPSNPAEEVAFAEVARSYRAATVKPTLPEEARKFKVQAEYAFSKKEFEGAVARYKEALDVAPWWPEGHFNRAMILSELSRYRDAIREMQKYLALVPDAPNARAAQDNIYRWEGDLKQSEVKQRPLNNKKNIGK